MKKLRVIELEDGQPIRWACNGYIVEKCYIQNLNIYTYAIEHPTNQEEALTYCKSEEGAQEYCNKVSVKNWRYLNGRWTYINERMPRVR